MKNDFFNQSRNSGKVSNALAKVQAELPVFTVDADGYNYKYLTLAKILEIVLPIAGKHNLSIMQFPSVFTVEGMPWVRVVTRLGCEDEWIDSSLEFPMIEPHKKTDNDIMMAASTVTYLRRSSLQAILGIAGADKDVEEMQKEQIESSENPNAMGLK